MKNDDRASSGTTPTPSRITVLAFLLMVLIGGSNAVAIRVSNLELPPFIGAGLRFLAASVIFWLIFFLRRLSFPDRRGWLGLSLFGILSVGASYSLIYWGLVELSASLTMIILSLGPLLTILLAVLHGLEKLTLRGLGGAIAALAGIIIAVGEELGTSVPVLPFLAVVAAAVCISEGSIVFKQLPRSDPVTVNAVSTTSGAVFHLLVSLLAGESWSFPGSPATIAAYAYLVVIGSVVLFFLYLFVLSRWTASATSYAFLLFPVATILVSAWLFGDSVSPRFMLGGAVALVGVWFGTMRPAGAIQATGRS